MNTTSKITQNLTDGSGRTAFLGEKVLAPVGDDGARCLKIVGVDRDGVTVLTTAGDFERLADLGDCMVIRRHTITAGGAA